MRVTHGDMNNGFVLAVDLGEVPCWEVDYGEVQLYPDTATGVKGCVLELPEAGSVDWCYWVHAVKVSKRVFSESCTMHMSICGREYRLFGSYDGLPAVQLGADGRLTFPDGEAPPLQEMQPGVVATVTATIPDHDSYVLSGGEDNGPLKVVEDVPWLDGTYFSAKNYKGMKKVCSWVSARVSGVGQGQVYLDASSNDTWNGRGDSSRRFVAAAGAGMDGDGQLEFEVDYWGHCTLYWAKLVYPAFTRVFQLRLLGVDFIQGIED